MPGPVVGQARFAVPFGTRKPVTLALGAFRDPLLAEGVVAVPGCDRSRVVGDDGRASQVVVSIEVGFVVAARESSPRCRYSIHPLPSRSKPYRLTRSSSPGNRRHHSRTSSDSRRLKTRSSGFGHYRCTYWFRHRQGFRTHRTPRYSLD